MKTQKLFLVALFCTGLFITSYGQNYTSQKTKQGNTSLVSENVADLNKTKSVVDDIRIDPIKNFPNPFAGKTIIEYHLWTSTKVSLLIVNERNEKIVSLFNGYQRDGLHRYLFDAHDLPSGIYYAVLRVGNTVIRESMIKQDDPSKAPLPGWE